MSDAKTKALDDHKRALKSSLGRLNVMKLRPLGLVASFFRGHQHKLSLKAGKGKILTVFSKGQ